MLLAACRQHDDRQIVRPFITAQASCELDAAHSRQHPVEQYHIRQDFIDPTDGVLRGIGTYHLMSGILQTGSDQRLDRRFIFNNKDRSGHQAISREVMRRFYEGMITD